VASARKLSLIYARASAKPMRSTPRTWLDWRDLTRSCCTPLKHRGEGSQAHLAIIRSREALVSSRTQLVNHVPKERSSPSVIACPSAKARSFHKRASEHIPKAHLPALGHILEQR
jgi:hypothetical protein